MYEIHYIIEFASSQLINGINNVFYINILEKDYAGTVSSLTGAAQPFILSYQSGDESIIVPIRGSECTVNFYNDGDTPLTVFYSEDDEAFRIDFYYRNIIGDQLLWSGFLLQDSCQEEFQDPPYVVQIKATDNIALLKDVPFDLGIGKFSLFAIIRAAIEKTGIALPVHFLSNIYENTTNDRGDDSVATMFEQTLVFTGAYQNEDGGWQDYYSILENIFKALNATFLQAQGRWYVIRFPEYKYFTNNNITGTFWQADFTLPQFATYQPNFLFEHGGANEFINADQTRRIERPFKSVKNTFNYHQPKSLIVQSDLQFPPGVVATPFATRTDTVDGVLLRYDDYSIDTYFPAWKHMSGDTSYLEVVTDTVTDTELERYIVTPGSTVNERGIQFNPIEVTKGDTFNFTLSFRTPTDVNPDVFIFKIQFILVTLAGTFYCLAPNYAPFTPLEWTFNFDYTYPESVLEATDSSKYINWDLSYYLDDLHKLPLIPEDGILLINVRASNDDTAGNVTTYWNDIRIEFTNYINQSTKIIGQYHLQEQADNIKNVYDEEIFTDDSPRNTIAGTLFTPAVTSFAFDIGNIYFNKTQYWHRLAIAESLRLGQIITLERKEIASRPRTVIEGSLIYNQPALSIINAIQIGSLPGLNFIWGVVDFDFYSGVASGVLRELYTDAEVQPGLEYTFSYIFEIN